MDREWKQVLIVVGVVAVLILGGYVGIKAYSGMDNSLTVVVSGSMEHSDKSTIGIIDTGDMVVMKNKDKGITTYVEGYNNGHSTFGEYGDVIIYNRPTGNPVIHRAIVWLDYNGDGTYAAPSLNDKDKGSLTKGELEKGKLWWTDTGNKNSFTKLVLRLPDGGTSNYKEFTLYCENCGKHSGYLTKGDSKNNPNFDCQGGISSGLVSKDQVKAVAGLEIPWLGTIKLFFNNNTKNVQSNTPYCLVFFILDVLGLIVMISLTWDYIDSRYYGRKDDPPTEYSE